MEQIERRVNDEGRRSSDTLITERIAKVETQIEMMKDNVAELKVDIKEVHSRITTGNREIMEKMDCLERSVQRNMSTAAEQHTQIEKSIRVEIDDLSRKVSIIENWRWMIVGGAVVLGYIIGNLDPLTKILHQ